MILPQRNAKIVAVTRGGRSEDYDVEEGAGPAVWEGEADAYFGRRKASVTEGQTLNIAFVSYVIVPGDLVPFQAGDVLTLKKRGATIVVKVREVPDRDMEFEEPQPIRLDLEDE